MHGITEEDISVGKRDVLVYGRGTAKVVVFVPHGGDPIGAVRVEFEGGVACVFENTDEQLKAIETVSVIPVSSWTQIWNPDEEWICKYSRGNLAGRVDENYWIVYSPEGIRHMNGPNAGEEAEERIRYGLSKANEMLRTQFGVHVQESDEDAAPGSD